MTQQYFEHLNYSFGNEGTTLEHQLLANDVRCLVCVAGCGSRVLPLFAKGPRTVVCSDLSTAQLHLTQLRIESARTLSMEDYIAFWGYPGKTISPEQRKELFASFALTGEAKEYLTQLFEQQQWQSVLYTGRWERTFAKLSSSVRFFMGSYTDRLFSFTDPDEYQRYIHRHFPRWRVAWLTFLLGNASVFNALLCKGKFPKKNIKQSMHRFYYEAFKRVIQQGLPRQNFFLQIVFFGQLKYAEGNPIEIQSEEIYRAIQKNIAKATIKYIAGDCLSIIPQLPEKVDFISFSDISSYFPYQIGRYYLQTIKPNLAPDCMIVERRYIHIPNQSDTTGFIDQASQYRKAIQQEKVQMYDVRVLQMKP